MTYNLNTNQLKQVQLMDAATGLRYNLTNSDGMIAGHFDNGLGGTLYIVQNQGTILKVQGGMFGFGSMDVMWITNKATVSSPCVYPTSIDIDGATDIVYVSCSQAFETVPEYYFQSVVFTGLDADLPLFTMYKPGMLVEGIAADFPIGLLASSLSGQGVQVQTFSSQTGLTSFANPAGIGSTVGIRPDILRHRVYVAANPAAVWCFHIRTGTVEWRADLQPLIANQGSSQQHLINDLTFDKSGNVYATDFDETGTYGQVFKVESNGANPSQFYKLPTGEAGNGITCYRPNGGVDLIIVGTDTVENGQLLGKSKIFVVPANDPNQARELQISGSWGGLDGLYLDDFSSSQQFTLWVVGNPTRTIYKIGTRDFTTANVINSVAVPPACNAGQSLGATTGVLFTPDTNPAFGPSAGSFAYVCTRGFNADGVYPVYRAIFAGSDAAVPMPTAQVNSVIRQYVSNATSADKGKIDSNRVIGGLGLAFALLACVISSVALFRSTQQISRQADSGL